MNSQPFVPSPSTCSGGAAAPQAWSRGTTALLLLVGSLLAGCGNARPEVFGEKTCPTWDQGIAPLMQDRCVRCHGEGRAEGDYRVDSYVAAVGRRDDGSARIVPGDDGSAFLRAMRGEVEHHSKLGTDSADLLTRWVVECRADPRTFRTHEHGWLTPTDYNFHGQALRRSGYDFSSCQKCHGDDLKGGKVGASCESCHAKGVTDCSTCHGSDKSPAPPKDLSGTRLTTNLGVGAHEVHLNDGPLHKAYDCSVCHTPVKDFSDATHLETNFDAVAEVVLKAVPGAATPSWDRSSASCTNACHGPKAADTAAKRMAAVWTSGKTEGECGTCHGIPPASHYGDDCTRCHGAGFSKTTVDAALHANGKVDFAGGGNACNVCHGNSENAAPPNDTQGRNDPKLASVGAHQAHVLAGRLRGPIGCEECHVVPKEILAPGHIDGGRAEVFPAGAGVIARADGATPAYDEVKTSCSSVYCHGGGTKLATDSATTLMREPVWTGGVSQINCGSCHGIPPKDGIHNPTLNITQCSLCHDSSIDSTGQFRFTTDATTGVKVYKHIDGKVNTTANP